MSPLNSQRGPEPCERAWEHITPPWTLEMTVALDNTSTAALCDPKLRTQLNCAQTATSKQLLFVLEDGFASHGHCVDGDDVC